MFVEEATIGRKRRSRSDYLSEPGMNAYKLEAIIRHYAEFRALYEDQGIEEISLGDGLVVNIHDVLRGISKLPTRQRQAVVLTCLWNMKERDAARLMGFDKWSAPVGAYKRLGLQKLVEMYWRDDDG